VHDGVGLPFEQGLFQKGLPVLAGWRPPGKTPALSFHEGHVLFPTSLMEHDLAGASLHTKNPARFPARAHFVSFSFPSTTNRS
jgi:hypothetical protein